MHDLRTTPDFGAGLSLDELVGMTAGEILSAQLPNSDVFSAVEQAAVLMYQRRLEAFLLAEVWADGHTVWHDSQQDEPVLVTPTGQVFRRGT